MRRRRGCINVHASLLPRWRGAAPIQRAILAGDEVSGVTIMQMDEGLDTGPMLLKRELDIRGKNAGQVTEEMAKLGAQALVDWLGHPTAARAAARRRRDLRVEDRQGRSADRLDASRPSEIERQVRAFNPVPGAWFEANGERIKLLRSRQSGSTRSRQAGRGAGRCLLIACGEGASGRCSSSAPGAAPMTPGELLRGFPIPKGTILP